MFKGRVFEAYDECGEIIECEVIMFYHSIENDLDYVFYTDNNYDENGNLNLYASRYLGEIDDKMDLEDIDSDDEWKLLDKALEMAKEGLNNGR
ncbi:MAG: DUF1292 domain-containing protein [Bacilli bacterium]|nr:DUF1292 domain-containing protein [Bacilli bacterium]